MDTESPFSSACKGSDGWRWVSNVIGVGAGFGIVTPLVVSMLGQARYLCAIGRAHVVPSWLALVHPATSTPVNACLPRGLHGGHRPLHRPRRAAQPRLHRHPLRLLHGGQRRCLPPLRRRRDDLPLADGSLPRFLLHGLRRLHLRVALRPPGQGQGAAARRLYHRHRPALQLFQFFVRQSRKPEFWGVPLMPWIPAVSIFLNVFLLGSLDGPSYLRFGCLSGFAVLVYVLYSVHASCDAEENGSLVVELADVGRQPHLEGADHDGSLKV